MTKRSEARPATAHITPFGLRLQPDLKGRLEAAAAAAGRSLNAEVVARLTESFELQAQIGELRTLVREKDRYLDAAIEELKQVRADGTELLAARGLLKALAALIRRDYEAAPPPDTSEEAAARKLIIDAASAVLHDHSSFSESSDAVSAASLDFVRTLAGRGVLPKSHRRKRREGP